MPATKIDYKRELRELYAPGRDPVLVEVPEFAFAMLDGHGDPNVAPAFAAAVEALYAVAYTAKFAVKREHGADFGMMPLEGLWWPPEPAAFLTGDKSAWDWTLMVMQPADVTPAIFEQARTAAARKRAGAPIDRVRLERFAEGCSAQVLHLGSYATEAPTIARLHAFIAEQGYQPAGKHHEIYLGDPRRSAPERLKTIIRQPVAARR